jgi:hypothetical protein
MHFGRRVCSRKEKIGYKSISFKKIYFAFFGGLWLGGTCLPKYAYYTIMLIFC